MRIVLALLVGLVLGCSSGINVPSASPEVVVHPDPSNNVLPKDPPKRQDLPPTWNEVRADGWPTAEWSYGLPPDFTKLPSDGLLAQHHSVQSQLTISLNKHQNLEVGEAGLQQFVLDYFISEASKSGKTVLAIRRNDTTTQYVTIAVQTIWNTLPPWTDKSGMNSSVDFFTQHDQTVYQLSCSSDATDLRTNSSTCFQVMDTLRVH